MWVLWLQSLAFYSSKDILVQNLRSINAKLYHIVVHTCQNVKLQGVGIQAPEESPNTDGIHVQNSINVRVVNTGIKTGDDCISIGPGTQNLWIQRVACGPGHGIRWGTIALIYTVMSHGYMLVVAHEFGLLFWFKKVFLCHCSIGSLGKGLEEESVQNVVVKNVVFNGTQNGLRIKSWGRPSNGFVKGVIFKQVVMKNVQNPIVIDQNYCPRNEGCPNQVYKS